MKKVRRITEIPEDLITCYNRGMTIRQCAEAIGLSFDATYRRIRLARERGLIKKTFYGDSVLNRLRSNEVRLGTFGEALDDLTKEEAALLVDEAKKQGCTAALIQFVLKEYLGNKLTGQDYASAVSRAIQAAEYAAEANARTDAVEVEKDALVKEVQRLRGLVFAAYHEGYAEAGGHWRSDSGWDKSESKAVVHPTGGDNG